MYRNSGDKRVIHSAEKLYAALVVLLKEKKFSKISIKAVCEQAGVGRATFYRNFDYVEDILRFKLAQSFDQLEGFQSTTEVLKTDKRAELAAFFDFWTTKDELLDIIIEADLWSLYDDAYNTASNSRLEMLSRELSLTETEATYLGQSIRASISSNLQLWLSRGKQEGPEELAKLFILTFETFNRVP